MFGARFFKVYTLLVTNISCSQGTFEDAFPFPVWWDRLVPCKVSSFFFFGMGEFATCSPSLAANPRVPVEISGYMMPALKYLVRISMGPNEETFKICVEHSSCTVGKKREIILENG